MILGAVVGILGGLVVAVLLVVVVGVGRSTPAPEAAAAGKPGESAAAAKAAPAQVTPKHGQPAAVGEENTRSGLNYVIKDRIVKLADAGGRRYLRFTAALEFAPKEEKKGSVRGNQLAVYRPELDDSEYQTVAEGKADPDKEFQARIKKFAPALEDVVTTVLSSKTSNDLGSLEGKEAAKKEIKERCNRILGEDEKITNVFFTDFVMQ